jgi:hypothetical protein
MATETSLIPQEDSGCGLQLPICEKKGKNEQLNRIK